MKKFLTAVAIAAMSLPMAASAATTILGKDANGGMAVIGSDPGSESIFNFAWGGALNGDGGGPPGSAFVKFSVDNTFELIFENYVPTGLDPKTGEFEVTGLVVLEEGGPRYTEQGSFCDNVNVLAEIRGKCSLIGGEFNENPLVTYRPDSSGNTPIMTLAAGTYYIGLYESESPERGGASFRIVEVPLPAGGLLLLTALGGAAMVRRRRKS